jgi:hypothetical protein
LVKSQRSADSSRKKRTKEENSSGTIAEVTVIVSSVTLKAADVSFKSKHKSDNVILGKESLQLIRKRATTAYIAGSSLTLPRAERAQETKIIIIDGARLIILGADELIITAEHTLSAFLKADLHRLHHSGGA